MDTGARRWDGIMPALVPQSPKTDEEIAAARALNADLFALTCLAQQLTPGQRRALIGSLAGMVGAQAFSGIIPAQEWP